MPFRYFHFYSFDNDDMKSSKRHAVLLSLIFLINSTFKANKILLVMFMRQEVSLITPLPRTRWILSEQTCYDLFPKVANSIPNEVVTV